MIKIDKEKCVGCGACKSVCPEIFEVGDDGKAFVKEQKSIPCVKEAIQYCPLKAISEQ